MNTWTKPQNKRRAVGGAWVTWKSESLCAYSGGAIQSEVHGRQRGIVLTIHDLRRTAASGLATLGVQLPVIEKVLNHQSGSFRGVCGVLHSYSAEKRAALELWSEHVKRLGTAPKGLPLAA